MSSEFWLAVGFFLIFEGIGPFFFPKRWRLFLLALSQQPDTMLRRIGGALFVAGSVISMLLLNRYHY